MKIGELNKEYLKFHFLIFFILIEFLFQDK
jgi:hypothetical protein